MGDGTGDTERDRVNFIKNIWKNWERNRLNYHRKYCKKKSNFNNPLLDCQRQYIIVSIYSKIDYLKFILCPWSKLV